MATRKRVRTVFALVVVTIALVALVATPASSATPRLNCVMNGNTHITPAGDGYTWEIAGAGPCLNFLSGPYFGTISGSGTSDSLGLCDGLLVQNLVIDVKFTFANLRTGVVKVVNEVWQAAITTFPVATPFLVSGGNDGLGAIATRIGLNCPPGGSSGSTFVFDTTTN